LLNSQERIQDFPYKTPRILWKRLSFKDAKIIPIIDVPIKKKIVAKLFKRRQNLFVA